MSAIPMSLVSPNRPAIDFVVARLIQEAKSLCHGDLTGKEQSDFLELAVNRHIVTERADWNPCCDLSDAVRIVEEIQSLVERVPTQSRRDEESEKYQQFSTPPHYAFVAAWAANLSPKDTVLEPSAGIGGLASWAFNRVENVWLNELSVRRTAILKRLIRDCGFEYEVFSENAEQLENVLPDYVRPSVCLVNPPFSSSAGRIQGKTAEAGAMHVEQAMMRLADGGRLVAILGRGMAPDKPTFAPWWSKISKQYTVRCNIGIPGQVYAKMGTRFESRLICVDRCGPTTTSPIVFDVANLAQAIGLLSVVRTMRGSVPAKQENLFGKGPGDESSLSGDGKRDSENVKRDIDSPSPPRKSARRSQNQRNNIRALQSRDAGLSISEKVGPHGSINAPVPPIAIEVIEPSSSSTEMTDAIFEAYRPQRMRVPGAKPHPTPLVQSAAMASVLPPVPTYRPKLPQNLIDDGMLSDCQIECVTYAGQAFEQWLEPTMIDGKQTTLRRGFFCGDSMGAGKGRVVSATIMDSFAHGQTKAIWMSRNSSLIKDAIRDWTDLGGKESDLIDLSKYKSHDLIPDRPGILFVTYGTLIAGTAKEKPMRLPRITRENLPDPDLFGYYEINHVLSLINRPSENSWRIARNYYLGDNKTIYRTIVGMMPDIGAEVPPKEIIWKALGIPLPAAPEKKAAGGRSRMDQILAWCGPDFEGVIAFDEAHRGKNALGEAPAGE